jgi:hypothetical protein
MAPEETLVDMIAQRRLIQVLSGLLSDVSGLLFYTTQLAEACQPLSLHASRHFVSLSDNSRGRIPVLDAVPNRQRTHPFSSSSSTGTRLTAEC